MESTKTFGIIDVKEASHIAIETAKKIFEGQQLLDWLITFGFLLKRLLPRAMNQRLAWKKLLHIQIFLEN